MFQTGNRLSKRLIEVQLKIIITDAALHIRSRKIQKRPRIGLFIATCAREMKVTGRTDYDIFGCKNEFTDIVRSFAIAPIATLILI